DDGTGPCRLRPEETLHFAFKIDLKRNCIVLGSFPDGRPWECHIHAQDLDAFLRKSAPTRGGQLSSDERQRQCESWLYDQLKQGKKRKKQLIRNEAVQKFGIAKRAFDRI